MNAISLTLLVSALVWAPAEAVETEQTARDTAADLARMQGDWMVTSMKVNGLKHEQQEAESLFRTIKGENFTVSRYSRVLSRGTFKLDATQSPKTIDSIVTSAPEPLTLLGIYEYDGDKLRICNALPGKPRPKDFGCRIGSQQTLIVWEPEGK
jgi:uncharacterized protein (TIGR03067 family)